MDKIKLSIIVPIFNVEKYLNKCIDSILNQNLPSFELILVDDGSPDNCGKICDEYADKNAHIKVIHKENGGLSDARNSGIMAASGEYVMFIDSDDYINDKIDINELYNYMDYDVIQYKMVYFYEKDNKMIYLQDMHLYNGMDVMEQLKNKVMNDELSVSACNKIVKKKIIEENQLYFEKDMLSEDIDWSLRLYLKVNSIYTCNLNAYVYRQKRSGSITNTNNEKHILSLYSIINKWMAYQYPSEEIKKIYFSYIAYQYTILIALINKKNCTKELKKEIWNKRYILQYSDNKKVKMSNTLIHFFGMTISVKIFQFYIYLKDKGYIKL